MLPGEQPGDLPPETSEAQSSTAKSWSVRAASILSADDWLVVGWVLSIKILLIAFGTKSFRILENKPLPGRCGWLEIWNRWDAIHYLQVAEFGYSASSVMKAWFYPLFPWSIRLVADVVGNYLLSAFVVSGCASVAAAILLRRIVHFDHAAS